MKVLLCDTARSHAGLMNAAVQLMDQEKEASALGAELVLRSSVNRKSGRYYQGERPTQQHAVAFRLLHGAPCELCRVSRV